MMAHGGSPPSPPADTASTATVVETGVVVDGACTVVVVSAAELVVVEP